MNRRTRYIVPFIVMGVAISLSSCGFDPNSEKLDNKQPSPTPTQNSDRPQAPKPLQPRITNKLLSLYFERLALQLRVKNI